MIVLGYHRYGFSEGCDYQIGSLSKPYPHGLTVSLHQMDGYRWYRCSHMVQDWYETQLRYTESIYPSYIPMVSATAQYDIKLRLWKWLP